MDTLYKKLLLSIAVGLLLNFSSAQEKVSKTISETFDLSDVGELQLDNKYGDVTINGWDKDIISITIDISVTHKKKDNANSLLDRVRPMLKAANEFVIIKTEIADKSEGFFAKYFNKANPFDFDRSNVQVNYTIYMPKSAKLDVNNKFGDIILSDWKGVLNLDAQHGDVWINNDLNKVNIDLKYGKLKAKSLNFGDIRLKNGSLSLTHSSNIRLTSSGSIIEIDEISSFEVYSSKDEITINKVQSLGGSLEFTKMQLGEVIDGIDMGAKIADIKISKITGPNAKIIIQQESTEIVMNIKGFGFAFDATLEEGLLRLPKSFTNINSTMLDKGKRMRQITADYGIDQTGLISISGVKGVILLREL